MTKSKYNTVKEIPFAWYEVDALEAWLDEQSQQGLQLVGIRGFSFGYKRAVFVKSTEAPTRYRVHIKPKDGYYTRREEYRETMRELGWEYVDRLNYRADIYRAARPDAVEINTDESALRDSIKSANRLDLVSSILLILLIPNILRNNLRFMRHYDGFYDMLLDGAALLTVSAALLAAFWLVLGVFGILRSLALRRRYLLDRSFRPDPEIRKRKHVRIALLTLSGVCVLFLMVVAIGSAGSSYDVPLSNCPVVLLESLSPEEAAQLDYDVDRLDAPHGTGGKYLFYSFATYRQDGPTVWFGDNYPGWGYSPFSYWVCVEDIRSESLAEKYYAEKAAAHDDWQTVQITGWDQAMYRQYTSTLQEDWNNNENVPADIIRHHHDLILRLGNRVVTVGYFGEADMYPRLNTLYARRTAPAAADAAA
mgnify:FL=1